jgi:hypothetical protein
VGESCERGGGGLERINVLGRTMVLECGMVVLTICGIGLVGRTTGSSLGNSSDVPSMVIHAGVQAGVNSSCIGVNIPVGCVAVRLWWWHCGWAGRPGSEPSIQETGWLRSASKLEGGREVETTVEAVFVRLWSGVDSIMDFDFEGVRCEGVRLKSWDLARTTARGGSWMAPSSAKLKASESKSGRSDNLFRGAYMLSSSGRYRLVEGRRVTAAWGLDIMGREEARLRIEKLAREEALQARVRPWVTILERWEAGGRVGVAGIGS